MSADQHWERITYFLDRVVPVATEYKVRMACHPHDPGSARGPGVPRRAPRSRQRGRTEEIREHHESPYHGLNFCQGTVTEMLRIRARRFYDVIRYFGSRKKIFNVHFRNINGKFLNFQEIYPDNGDIDMIEGDAGVQRGRLRHDDARPRPEVAADPKGLQAFTVSGYIQPHCRDAEPQTVMATFSV